MKVSELTIENIINYLRIDVTVNDDVKASAKKEVEMMLVAAKKYASSFTGLPESSQDGEKSLEDYEDITIAVLAIISDMYENRIANIEKQTYSNKTVECILSMHSFNLV